jgi:hypothetical protein
MISLSVSNLQCKFLRFFFVWYNLKLYLFNKNLFEMMHFSWWIFYFGIYSKILQMLVSFPYSLFITWWPLGISFISCFVSCFLLWFTQYSYFPPKVSFTLEFVPKSFECYLVLHIHYWSLSDHHILVFFHVLFFVIYTIFILTFFHVWLFWSLPIMIICIGPIDHQVQFAISKFKNLSKIFKVIFGLFQSLEIN